MITHSFVSQIAGSVANAQTACQTLGFMVSNRQPDNPAAIKAGDGLFKIIDSIDASLFWSGCFPAFQNSTTASLGETKRRLAACLMPPGTSLDIDGRPVQATGPALMGATVAVLQDTLSELKSFIERGLIIYGFQLNDSEQRIQSTGERIRRLSTTHKVSPALLLERVKMHFGTIRALEITDLFFPHPMEYLTHCDYLEIPARPEPAMVCVKESRHPISNLSRITGLRAQESGDMKAAAENIFIMPSIRYRSFIEDSPLRGFAAMQLVSAPLSPAIEELKSFVEGQKRLLLDTLERLRSRRLSQETKKNPDFLDSLRRQAEPIAFQYLSASISTILEIFIDRKDRDFAVALLEEVLEALLQTLQMEVQKAEPSALVALLAYSASHMNGLKKRMVPKEDISDYQNRLLDLVGAELTEFIAVNVFVDDETFQMPARVFEQLLNQIRETLQRNGPIVGELIESGEDLADAGVLSMLGSIVIAAQKEDIVETGGMAGLEITGAETAACAVASSGLEMAERVIEKAGEEVNRQVIDILLDLLEDPDRFQDKAVFIEAACLLLKHGTDEDRKNVFKKLKALGSDLRVSRPEVLVGVAEALLEVSPDEMVIPLYLQRTLKLPLPHLRLRAVTVLNQYAEKTDQRSVFRKDILDVLHGLIHLPDDPQKHPFSDNHPNRLHIEAARLLDDLEPDWDRALRDDPEFQMLRPSV